MRIGINARYLQNPHSGIENYLLNLTLSLKKIDSRNDYVLFFGNDKRSIPGVFRDGDFEYDLSRMAAGNQASKILWAHFYLPHAIKRMKLDLFHEPSFIAPLIKRCPTVITVYDVAYLRVPRCYTYRNKLYLKMLLSKSLKDSNAVIAISENTKNDIIDNFSILPEKIRVVHAGVDEVFGPMDDKAELERVKSAYGIKRRFILTVSLISPRKNLTGLIRAFKRLKDQKKIEHQLVIVGQKGWLWKDVFKEISLNGLEEDAIFCGYVPKEDLLRLYNAAALFAYPSLYEGFGLPLLEAMACGCPVVASKTSSMPEVCGDAALLVNPEDAGELAQAIHRLITDECLRQDLIERGRQRIKEFSWKKAAEETLAVYADAVSGNI